MSQRLFYICCGLGLIIGAALLRYGQGMSLSVVTISIAVGAVVVLLIGAWRKRQGFK